MKLSFLRFECDISFFLLTLMSQLRGVSTKPATSKIKLFATIVNGFQPSTNVTKNSMLDVAGSYKRLWLLFILKYLFTSLFLICKAVTLIFCNGIDYNWSPQIMCFMSDKKGEAKHVFFHHLTCIFNFLIHWVLIILLYSFLYKYIINGRNEF